ncbi:transmembrane protein 107-like [Patiria miniata]|uniref:Transmembrane protein 107 n=1 Tax=Patiria miniata TaxID=46514 RepID=A0A914BIU6_PATMI|nr:transmembrane protein 107-like [Patiria miniata]XP_038076207.1 transmembrane protein 107-like [Patiria miniata]XP_038076208.1 transmembrane protein 107-like [Patiria miniata]
MAGITHLIPARFLCLIAHMVVSITILWSRDANIRACLPSSYTQADYNSADTGFLAGLILSLIFIAMELAGFMSGVTMFVNMESLFSITAHAVGAVFLSYFLLEAWPCNTYWYMFGCSSAFPFVVDTFVIISKIFFNKSS